MIKRYTFLKHPFYFVLENASKMVNGLEKCVAVFYDEHTANTHVLSFENQLSVINIEDISFVQELRKVKHSCNWIKKDQVLFSLEDDSVGQLSFRDEENASVLEMRFKNHSDGNYDVLYFYFKNNIGNFKLSNMDAAMAVNAKEIIQNLLHKQVAVIIKSTYGNFEIHQKISQTLVTDSYQNKITKLEQQQFDVAKTSYTYVLSRLIKNEIIEFSLSDKAIQKLMDNKVSLEIAEGILLNTIELIINKFNPTSFYQITADDLLIVAEVSNPSLSIKEESLNKTVLFLDRYEAAAKLLVSKNYKLTGFNIGESCSPRVSPAAISDVLKKHHKKIITLFNQHPNKWQIIRSQFKPVVNIVERYSYSAQTKMGA